MLKASILVHVAVAAIVLASAAGAAPVVTQPTSTVLATGTKLVGTSKEEILMSTPLGLIRCGTASLKGNLTTNSTASGNKLEVTFASFTGTDAGGECTTWTGGVTITPNHPTSSPVNGLPWCLEATAASDQGKVRGGGCSSATRPIRFGMDFTALGICVYQRTEAAVTEIQTDVEPSKDALLHLREQEWKLFEGGFSCPSSAKLSMTFTMETEAGSTVWFSS
jgi:hypothetical protein